MRAYDLFKGLVGKIVKQKDVDLYEGSYIYINKTWRSFKRDAYDRFSEDHDGLVEGQSSYYGCDTGCMGYSISLDKEGEDEHYKFFWDEQEAIKYAKELANKYGVPAILYKELDD